MKLTRSPFASGKRLFHFAEHDPKRDAHLLESHCRKHAGAIEKIDKDARKRMKLAHQGAIGPPLPEPADALEVARLHHDAIKAFGPATARGVEEGHFGLGQAKPAHHEAAKRLPRLHQLHAFKPTPQLFEIEAPMIGVQRHGHIGNLAPPHSRGEEMVPRMEEGEKNHELARGQCDHESIKVNLLRVLGQPVTLDGGIEPRFLGVGHLGTDAMDLHRVVAELDVVMVADIALLAPVVATGQGAKDAAGIVEGIEADEKVDVAKLPEAGIGIKQGQAETLEQHRLDAVLAK